MKEYWKEWYESAALGAYTGPSLGTRKWFPSPVGESDDLECRSDLLTAVSDGCGGQVMVPDIRKIGILDKRFLVSKKRGTNLFDLSNTWKKVLNQHIDEYIAVDPVMIYDNFSKVQNNLTAGEMEADGISAPIQHTLDAWLGLTST